MTQAGGFEWDADNIVGQVNYRRLLNLFHLMNAYINHQATLSDGSIVTMTRIVNLLEDLDNVVYLSNSQNWFPINGNGHAFVTISWDNELEAADVVELNQPQNRREKREKRTNVPIKKLSSIPDLYCLIAPEIIKKDIASVILIDD